MAIRIVAMNPTWQVTVLAAWLQAAGWTVESGLAPSGRTYCLATLANGSRLLAQDAWGRAFEYELRAPGKDYIWHGDRDALCALADAAAAAEL